MNESESDDDDDDVDEEVVVDDDDDDDEDAAPDVHRFHAGSTPQQLGAEEPRPRGPTGTDDQSILFEMKPSQRPPSPTKTSKTT